MKNGLELNIPIFIEDGLSEFIYRGGLEIAQNNFLCYCKIFNNEISEIYNDENKI